MSDHKEMKPKTYKLLPAINNKFSIFFIVILFLIPTSSTISQSTLSASEHCAKSCECNQTINSARCENFDDLIESYKDDRRFHQLMPIKSLDLSNNQIDKLSTKLELLKDIEELNLSHNRLSHFIKLNVKNLQKLDLSHNRITSAKLKKIPKTVVELNLSHNEITYLPVDVMKFKQLRKLEMTGNPLNCTCDTLHVRNWLNTNNVWTDKIVCSSPANVKGQPWLQVRQNDICFEPSTTPASKYNWDNYDDNEVMMGDQPQPDENEEETKTEDEDEEYDDTVDQGKVESDQKTASKETEKDEEESKNDEEESKNEDVFDTKTDEEHKDDTTQSENDDNEGLIPVTPETKDEDEGKDDTNVDGEGSGSDVESSSPSSLLEEDNDDGSGSGGGAIEDLGIFNNEESSSTAPLDSQRIRLGDENDSIALPSNDGNDDETKKAAQDNKGTYVLLGILALCLIALMVFVMMKNKKEKNRNRRYDVEKNGGTELQDMDRRLLGKPTDKNGNGNGKVEHIPLMNGHKDDKPYFDTPSITVDEPNLTNDDEPKVNGNGRGPVEPVHEVPSKSKPLEGMPDSDEEHQPESLNVSPETPKRYSPIYTRLPPSERYSPVYSPETGRVKIKLTETPKPKTPVVVTRSRSGERDYVNTIKTDQ